MNTSDKRWLVPALALAVIVQGGLALADDHAAEAARPVTVGIDPPEYGPYGAESDGRQLYVSICQACHMPDARGAKGAGRYPALAGNPKLGSPDYAEYVVLNGLRSMPSVGRSLSDAQVAAVVNYVITHFGNQSQLLATPADVAAKRLAGGSSQ